LRLSLVVLSAVILIAALRAQAPEGPPKPGSEHEKPRLLCGEWASEGDAKASAFGPGGKYSGIETCEWFAGKFAVVCKTKHHDGGQLKGMSVLSYDTYQKSYIYFETNNWGENVYSRGAVNGDTWTWNNDSRWAAKRSTAASPMKQTSRDAASYKFEMAAGSDPMTLVMEGKQNSPKIIAPLAPVTAVNRLLHWQSASKKNGSAAARGQRLRFLLCAPPLCYQNPNPESSLPHAVISSGGTLGPVVDGFGLCSWMLPPAR